MILVRKLRKPGQLVVINYGRAGVSSTASMTLTLAADSRQKGIEPFQRPVSGLKCA